MKPISPLPLSVSDLDDDPEAMFRERDQAAPLEDIRTSQMKTLLDVSRRMNATLDEDVLLPYMMEQVTRLMDADYGHLIFHVLPSDGAIDKDASPWKVQVMVDREGRTPDIQSISSTIIQRVTETRAPLLLEDALSDPTMSESRSAQELGLRSLMAVPLLSRDRLLGVLSVEHRGRVAKFNNEHLDFLQIFANQAAVAIENARLYRSLRDAQAKLTQAYRAMRLEAEESHQQLIQERRRLDVLESELRHLDKMAALGTMISSIAHELNNPLTGALGFAQLIGMSAKLSDKHREQMNLVIGEMTRCADILRNLLKFSRKSGIQRTPVLLNSLVADVVALRRYHMEVHNTRIIEEYDDRIQAMLADHHQLKGVILNILNNAFDAIQETKGAGCIRVETRLSASNQVHIDISDDGGGIREPEKIFDPFYTTKPVGKGTGLGMSVAFGVVRAHGGSIEARNVDGGARISISLPLEYVDFQEESENAEERPRRGPGHVSGRVLVVDDEVVIRELCQAILEGEGFQVDVAKDADEGISRIGEHTYQLIISDIKMPGRLSGVEFMRFIREHHADRFEHAMYITGDVMTADLRAALAEEGTRLLAKPFGVRNLVDAVRSVLNRES